MNDKKNPIEEYLLNNDENSNNLISKEIFEVDNLENLDFKTDLSDNDIKNISCMHYNDLFLKKIGFKPIFINYYIKFMKLRISKDRQSRSEFVNINKTSNEDETLTKLNEFTSIKDSKK